MKAKHWSSPATTARVLELLADLDWRTARVADVGAGRGYFSRVLCDALRARGDLDPREHVSACDLIPSSFEFDGIPCEKIRDDGRLPWPDATFDAVVNIEVIEHVEDQFAFLRELARITKPGGLVVVTTPNVLNMNSRLRTLLCGFPVLFDPLPLSSHDPRRLGGHIHPISPYFLAYGALRAGLVDPRLCYDRRKTSAVIWTVLLSPLLWSARAAQHLRLARKKPDILIENRTLLAQQESFDLWTSRTAVVAARKPHSLARVGSEIGDTRERSARGGVA